MAETPITLGELKQLANQKGRLRAPAREALTQYSRLDALIAPRVKILVDKSAHTVRLDTDAVLAVPVM